MRFASVQKLCVIAGMWAGLIGGGAPASAADGPVDYRILATSKTSTMEKELNEAARTGYRFSRVMGGKTANGGQEVVVAVVKDSASPEQTGLTYRLLATSRTSTMQKELQEAAEAGYEYLDQTVFATAFGGREVVVILERDAAKKAGVSRYRLLATNKTSTMERELKEAGKDGFLLVGFTVGKTEMGGDEIVAILRKS